MSSFSNLSFWGNTAGFSIPTQVQVAEDESAIGAVCRSIARRNRPLSVANCRKDCYCTNKQGEVVATHYELTIGKALRSGGYAVEGRIWCAIKHN
jgi:hypothetical protein